MNCDQMDKLLVAQAAHFVMRTTCLFFRLMSLVEYRQHIIQGNIFRGQ